MSLRTWVLSFSLLCLLQWVDWALLLGPAQCRMAAPVPGITWRWQHAAEGESIHCLLSPFISRKKNLFQKPILEDVYCSLIGQNSARCSNLSQWTARKMELPFFFFKSSGSRVIFLDSWKYMGVRFLNKENTNWQRKGGVALYRQQCLLLCVK